MSASPVTISRLEWPVVIVGGGPAGAIAARRMASAGIEVLLVEKSCFPREKVCGGCLGGLTLSLLDSVGLGDLPIQLGGQPLETLRLATGRRSARTAVGHRIAVSRAALDEALLAEAANAGATVRQGVVASVKEAAEERRTVELKSPEGTTSVRARLVILAHGLAGRLPSDANITHQQPSTARLGIGAVFRDAVFNKAALQDARTDELLMAVGPHGYVGVAPIEDNAWDIAAAMDKQEIARCGGPAAAMAAGLREIAPTLAEEIARRDFQGSPAMQRQPSRVAAERLLLIGDAAGYVEPFTGEGIGWALLAGKQAAELTTKAFQRDNLESLPNAWESTHRQTVRRRQRVCQWVSGALRYRLVRQLAVEGLRLAPRLAAPVVKAIDHAA